MVSTDAADPNDAFVLSSWSEAQALRLLARRGCDIRRAPHEAQFALQDIARQAGLNWEDIAASLRRNGRPHLGNVLIDRP